MATSSNGAAGAAVSEDYVRMLSDGDVAGVKNSVVAAMRSVAEGPKCRAMLALAAERVRACGVEAATALADALLSLPGLRDITFGREHYLLLTAAAATTAAADAHAQSIVYDERIFNVPPNLAQSVLPIERLECMRRLMRACEATANAPLAESVAFRALPTYYDVCRQLRSDGGLPGARPAITAFLSDLGFFLQRRGLFLEASRVFATLHEYTAQAADLRCAVTCALLADAGPSRDRFIETYYTMPEAGTLGELGSVLKNAFHAQVLARQDTEIIARAAGDNAPPGAVRAAANQHNIRAISRIFDNISAADLAGMLDGLDERAVLAAVAESVAEGRLRAKVDEATAWVDFEVPDSADAMSAWDARLGTVCGSIARATELVTTEYPDLRRILQEGE